MTDDLIALIVKETGWTLEYIREQPLIYLYALVEEIWYLRSIESYAHSYNAALIVCALVSTRTRRYKPENIIGKCPERSVMTKKRLTSKPQSQVITLLNGKEYKLPALNLNVMADLEEEFDMSLEEVGNLLQTRQMSALRRTLVIMLRSEYPDIATRERIGKLIDMTNLESVANAVGKALGG